jgi:hypothetical protein
LFFCFTGLFYFLQYKKNPYQILSAILLLACVGFFLAHIIQHVRLYYHLYPALSYALLLFGILIGVQVRQETADKSDYISIAVMSISLGVFLWVFNKSLWSILVLQPLLFFSYFSVLLGGIFFLQKKMTLLKSALSLCSIIGCAYLFSYWSGQTDWYAHKFFLVILLMLLMVGVAVPGDTRNKLRIQGVTIVAMLIFAYPLYFLNMLHNIALNSKEQLQPMIAFLRAHAAGQTVYFFSIRNTDAYPAVDYAHAKVATRIQSFSVSRGLFKAFDLQDKQKREDQQRMISFVTEDLLKHHPTFIFVDVKKNPMEPQLNIDYLGFFLQSKIFAKLWGKYTYFATIEQLPLYQFDVYCSG